MGFVPPSSLIFAVILAVWAAYLVQHWIHRRDHIATARSVDRFSEAMRVLERRQLRPHLDLSEPAIRSYSVSLTRPASPDVMVKRAQRSVPLSQAGAVGETQTAPVGGGWAGHADAGGSDARRSATGRGSLSATGATAVLPPASASGNSVRTRGMVLLGAAALMLVLTALGMIGVWPWWTALVGISTFAAVLIAVRQSVRRVSRARVNSVAPARSDRSRVVRAPIAGATAASAVAERGSAPVREFGAAASAPAVDSTRKATVGRSAAAAGGGAAAVLAATIQTEAEELAAAAKVAVHEVIRPATSRGVYDIDAVEQVAAAASSSRVNTAADRPVKPLLPGTWQPVPVPRPTYTMKAKAHSQPLPTELPADGAALSLDEEFEELPVAIRDLA